MFSLIAQVVITPLWAVNSILWLFNLSSYKTMAELTKVFDMEDQKLINKLKSLESVEDINKRRKLIKIAKCNHYLRTSRKSSEANKVYKVDFKKKKLISKEIGNIVVLFPDKKEK